MKSRFSGGQNRQNAAKKPARPSGGRLLLFNKPFGVISQFSPSPPHATLADFVRVPDVYPAGRLDTDSEGLLLLTDDGALQHRIAHPKFKKEKIYWAQVEGLATEAQLAALRQGVLLKDGKTAPAQAKIIAPPNLWAREPPIRQRKTVPTSWLELRLTEGKNRQVRRMTAHVGLPTLRLVRVGMGRLTLDGLALGQWREASAAEMAQFLR